MDRNVKRVLLVIIMMIARLYFMSGDAAEVLRREHRKQRRIVYLFAAMGVLLSGPGYASLARDLQLPKGAPSHLCLLPDRVPNRPARFQLPVGYSPIHLALYQRRDTPQDFKDYFHVPREVFERTVQALTRDNEGQPGRIMSSNPRNRALRAGAEFKIAVAFYYFAHGGVWKTTGNVSGRGPSWVGKIVRRVASSIIVRLGPTYMRKPTPEELDEIIKAFASRKGIGNVGLAADGTHVPFNPENVWQQAGLHGTGPT
jgi:hypothetical protein